MHHHPDKNPDNKNHLDDLGDLVCDISCDMCDYNLFLAITLSCFIVKTSRLDSSGKRYRQCLVPPAQLVTFACVAYSVEW